MPRTSHRPLAALLGLTLAAGLSVTTGPTSAAGPGNRSGSGPGEPQPPKTATSVGYGGAVSSVDPYASKVGLDVLKRGGNAADAAVAMASALGVTEPYSAGVGGGGYFVYYDARARKVHTLDGRETAPRHVKDDVFVDPETEKEYSFADLVSSGLSVGTPGTPATWDKAVRRWGRWSLAKALRPSIALARKGFVVDQTFREQTTQNAERFAQFPATRDLFLPGGEAPPVGSVFRNPDLADTLRSIARQGTRRAFYRGPIAREIVETVQDPKTTPDATLPAPKGSMTVRDLKEYRLRSQKPSHVGYRGYDVYGMAPSSSGGSTVGEALNILETKDIAAMDDGEALHNYLEASALAFADRGKYVGDPAYVDVPLRDLLSDRFAKERACEIGATAMTKPTSFGDVDDYDGVCDDPAPTGTEAKDTENISTTNLTVTDKWGNIAEYTLTIEQTGGSGMVVPGRGFLLNNELTDFTTVYDKNDPNRIQPGKRPRSSMSPTIVLRNGRPVVALGSPGGATIITTVLQMLFNHLDRGMTLPQALAAPRASQRNALTTPAEPAFIAAYGTVLEDVYKHDLVLSGDGLTTNPDIGAATAIGFGPGGRLTAVAEPERRGGGAAYVVSRKR
ncbi:MAG: gamma-glutamyltransferase [Nocardioides sp.]